MRALKVSLQLAASLYSTGMVIVSTTNTIQSWEPNTSPSLNNGIVKISGSLHWFNSWSGGVSVKNS
jgi:hypothetical protein